jgi:hypothetical protein
LFGKILTGNHRKPWFLPSNIGLSCKKNPIIQSYDLSICEPDHDLDVFEMLAASLVFGCLTAVSRISKGF